MLGPTPRRTARLVAPALILTVLVGVVSGCSDDPRPVPAAESDPPSAAAPVPPEPTPVVPAVRTKIRRGEITGRLPVKRRKRLVKEIAGVTDRWLDAAYVEGSYPRTNFKKAFPGFTSGATRSARRDRTLMTNADLGKRIDEVRVKRRTVTVDLLAVGGEARAATARVHLAFATKGVQHRVQVTGRLFLTQKDGRWRVFGYDVSKGGA